MNSSRCLKRNVPAFVIRFTRKCPGYSSGGSCSGNGRGERPIERGGWAPAQGFVGALVVVQRPEGVEGALLGGERAAGRADRVGLQGLVHPLVGAVLLRVSRQDPLVLDPELQPPDIELGEAVDAAGGERHAVIGADRLRQAKGAEGVLEDRAHAAPLGRAEALAGEQVARVLVGDRQRVTVEPVAGPEVAFEVGRPEVVGGGGRQRHDARMLMGPAAPALLDQAPAGQQVARRTHGRPGEGRIPGLEPVEQFLGSPAGVSATGGADQLGHGRRDAMRAVVGCPTLVVQRGPAALLEAVEPLVAGLATDPVPRAQLRHRVQAAPLVGDEAFTFVHG